jgi:PAS domain S-box-containing protein
LLVLAFAMSDVFTPLPAGLPPSFVPALLDLLPSGVIYYLPIKDAAGAVVDFSFAYLNPAAQRTLELPAQPTTTYLGQWPTSEAFDFHRDTFLAGTPARRDDFYQAEGQYAYIQAQACRVEEGLLVCFLHLADQPRTVIEEALRESQAREQQARAEVERQRGELMRVFEQAPVGIAVYRGPQHLIDLANSTVYRIWGRPYKKGLGEPLLDLLPEIAGQGFDQLLDQVRTTGEPYRGYSVPSHIQRNGQLETVYWDFVYVPMYEADGTAYGVLTVAMEVTEQVLARQLLEEKERQTTLLNEELQAANEEIRANNQVLTSVQLALRQLNEKLEARVAERTEQLRAQQAQFQYIFEQAPVAICVFRGAAYVIELVNSLMGDMLGHAPAQLTGKPFFEALPELVGQGLREILDEVRRTGTPFTAQARPIRLVRHHTTEVGYFDFVYQPLRNPSGVLDIVCVATEITAQVLARQQVQTLNEELAGINEELTTTNEELHESNNRLMRTNAELDTFVYSASHDLKAPITNIEGLLLALRRHLPPQAMQTELVPQLLGMMDGAVQRFQETLGHLTDVTRLQQVMADQTTEAVDLPALIEAVRLDILPELMAAEATLSLDLAGCSAVHFPAKNLRSIIYNLLSNAIKYRDPMRQPYILLRGYWAESDHLVLDVQDNGLGLTEQEQRELFSLFRRMHTHVSGSGVGLYMVKKMVDNAGGTLSVQSQAGVGSTFTVTLPATRPATC